MERSFTLTATVGGQLQIYPLWRPFHESPFLFGGLKYRRNVDGNAKGLDLAGVELCGLCGP